MADRHTLEELNNCSREELITIVFMMQGQLVTLNENIERLIEQVRIANSYRFGIHAETLDSIDGQLSFFDEAESCCDLSVPEPAAEKVLPSRRNHKKKKATGNESERFSGRNTSSVSGIHRRTGYVLWCRQLAQNEG